MEEPLTTEPINHLLAINFDRRVSPDVAKSQLLAFKATKDMTLADVEARITQLSGRAVTTLPPGESRTSNWYHHLLWINHDDEISAYSPFMYMLE